MRRKVWRIQGRSPREKASLKAGQSEGANEGLGDRGVADEAPGDAVGGDLGGSQVMDHDEVVAVEGYEASDLEKEELASAQYHSAGREAL